MAVEIKVPTIGESITEGRLSRWLKKDGERVRADEPVFELETDKATGEVPAPASGVLRISVPEGETVTVGAVVGRIEEEAAAPTSKPPPDQKPAREKSAPPGKPATPPAAEREAPAPAEVEALLSPAARQLVEDHGLDVRQLSGTGRGGRITKEDVLNYLERCQTPEARKPAAPPAPPPAPPPLEARPAPAERETRQRMSAIRQRIAERLVAAQSTAAILTTFNEVDMSAVMALRAKYKETFQKKHGVGLGLMSFFVKACVEALRAFPVVNARIDGNDIVYHHYYHIGIAVSTERGLMVPVVRDADRLTVAAIEKQIAALAEKARAGKITVNDLQGGTFTITNGGVFGSLLSTPLLNPPQSAILGMHAIQKRPVAIEDQVMVRPMMYLALSYDHRLIDGRDAVLFLVRVKECIEAPERLLLEV
ncbi:MAG TPA: 2-oxoglutarate dehydrogenase complex dihydrolipoyllysine-residue succinyltransferase [Gemmataceae bacterium]|nr:2-oxoglutarate dehydrogenase complex dihydrolipoyllysine-residue succinyltransferase [Gemmataceae bacterium]